MGSTLNFYKCKIISRTQNWDLPFPLGCITTSHFEVPLSLASSFLRVALFLVVLLSYCSKLSLWVPPLGIYTQEGRDQFSLEHSLRSLRAVHISIILFDLVRPAVAWWHGWHLKLGLDDRSWEQAALWVSLGFVAFGFVAYRRWQFQPFWLQSKYRDHIQASILLKG